MRCRKRDHSSICFRYNHVWYVCVCVCICEWVSECGVWDAFVFLWCLPCAVIIAIFTEKHVMLNRLSETLWWDALDQMHSHTHPTHICGTYSTHFRPNRPPIAHRLGARHTYTHIFHLTEVIRDDIFDRDLLFRVRHTFQDARSETAPTAEARALELYYILLLAHALLLLPYDVHFGPKLSTIWNHIMCWGTCGQLLSARISTYSNTYAIADTADYHFGRCNRIRLMHSGDDQLSINACDLWIIWIWAPSKWHKSDKRSQAGTSTGSIDDIINIQSHVASGWVDFYRSLLLSISIVAIENIYLIACGDFVQPATGDAMCLRRLAVWHDLMMCFV